MTSLPITLSGGISAPRKFVGHVKIHKEEKKVRLSTKWKKSLSEGVKKYEIFARNKKIATISAKHHREETIRLHPHRIPDHISKKYRQYLHNKYKIRAVGAQGVVSPFTALKVKRS